MGHDEFFELTHSPPAHFLMMNLFLEKKRYMIGMPIFNDKINDKILDYFLVK